MAYCGDQRGARISSQIYQELLQRKRQKPVRASSIYVNICLPSAGPSIHCLRDSNRLMVNHHRFSYNQCSTSSEIASRLEYSLITGPLMRYLPSGGQTINHMGSLNWIGILKRGQYSLYGHQVAHPLSLDPRIVGALQCPTGVSGQASLLAFNPMMHTERFLLKLLV